MSVIKIVFDSIIDVLSMNLFVLGYRISLMEIFLFVVLGGLALTFIFNIAE